MITKTKDYKKLYLRVFKYFGNDPQTVGWILQEQESLSGKSPLDLLIIGEFDKAMEYANAVLTKWKK